MGKYDLKFISDEDLFNHVKGTIEKYRFSIDLKRFNKNAIDPIKLTFDSKVYEKNISQIIEEEISRQIDKSNTNHIGFFHQNIFKYMSTEWIVPTEGFDIVNKSKLIFVEMKNKHNTMNSSSAQKTYIRMQNQILKDSKALCFLVEVISKKSQDIPWQISIDKVPTKHPKIRKISIDKFYEIVTGDKNAFKNFCSVLPRVIDDVLKSLKTDVYKNTVLNELENISSDILKSLYLTTFKSYEGFSTLELK